MESASYTTLSRQSGLLREMQVIANNIANAQTTGFKQEGVIFSEYVTSGDGGESISMADARGLLAGIEKKTSLTIFDQFLPSTVRNQLTVDSVRWARRQGRKSIPFMGFS